MPQNAVRKKILVLTSTFPRWKDDVEPPFVYELCRRLTDSYNVHVLAPHAPGAASEERLNGIQVTRHRYFFSHWETLAYQGGMLANLKKNPLKYCLVPFFFFSQLHALKRLLHQQHFDLIHAHWLIPQGLIALTAKFLVKTAPPLLTTSHGGDLFALRGSLARRLKRQVAIHSCAVTVVSRSMSSALAKLEVDQKRINIIPMGVDLQTVFVPPVKRERTEVLLFVGRLVEKKGLKFLIEALPQILVEYPGVRLRIVGDGQEKNLLQKRVSELGIGNRVDFLGGVKNESLPALYQTSDVVVFPSVIADGGDREGFGLVLVEALGCECATVVTDLPAMQDIISDGKTALVVPQYDSQQITEKVLRLLKESELRRSLGKRGRRYVLQRFDWENVIRQYTDLIHSVTG